MWRAALISLFLWLPVCHASDDADSKQWVRDWRLERPFLHGFIGVMSLNTVPLFPTEWHKAKARPSEPENQGPDGKYLNAQHVWLTMMVFINPAVAALPEHAHLMAEPGCYEGRAASDHKKIVHRHCKADEKESVLPDRFKPLEVTPEKHNAWMEKVRARISPQKD